MLPIFLLLILSFATFVLPEICQASEDTEILPIAQSEKVRLYVDQNQNTKKHSPFFWSKYYRKKNSLIDREFKWDRYQKNYPTSHLYHPPLREMDYLRQERADRRVENRKIFLRNRAKQLEEFHPEIVPYSE